MKRMLVEGVVLCVIVLFVYGGCKVADVESAKLHIKKRDYTTAEKLLKNELETDPKNPDALYLMGKLQYIKQEYEKAIITLGMAKESRKLEPSEQEEVNKMLKSLTSLSLKRGLDYYNQAVANRDKVASVAETSILDTASMLLQAHIESSEGNRAPEAAKAMTGIVYMKNDPAVLEARIDKSRIEGGDLKMDYEAIVAMYANKKQYEDAIASMDKMAVLTGETSESRTNKAYLHILANHIDQAYEEFKQLALEKPDGRNIQFFLGYCLYKKERYEEAMNVYERLLSFDPAFAEAAYNLALSGYKLIKTLPAKSDTAKVDRSQSLLQTSISFLERIVNDKSAVIDASYWDLLAVLHARAGNELFSKNAIVKSKKLTEEQAKMKASIVSSETK